MAQADPASSYQSSDLTPAEKKALEKEAAREARLVTRTGQDGGARTFTFGGAEDETDAAGPVMINVVVDMTDEGKKVPHPTPGRPAYYSSLPMGNKVFGYSAFYQKDDPSAAEVKELMDKELSMQGYRMATREHDPSLILTYFWGYMDSSDGAMSQGGGGLAASMLRGNPYATDYNKVAPDHRMDSQSESYESIWYVLVSAFDARDWVHRKLTLLWCAHIYTPSWGHYMTQVLPAMIATAGPVLGRETSRPQMVMGHAEPRGRVILGTPELAK